MPAHRRRKRLLPRHDVWLREQARRQHAMFGLAPLRRPNLAPFAEELARVTRERLAVLDTLVRDATITDMQRLMDDRALSAVELTLYFIDRIQRYDGRLYSVAELNPDALEIAAALDRMRQTGQSYGPLHGIPLLLKDNIGTGDAMHTTAGTAVLLDARCDRDAFLVARLRAAGAVLLGKTNMSEWANYMSDRSASGWSAVGGQVRNPHGRFDVGGSSSGSGAAVAARLAVAAIGTETYGSIISPAGRCGVVGHKPSHGLVSRDRIIPITDATDTAGPIARNALDAALVLEALAGPDQNDTATMALSPTRRSGLTPASDPAVLHGKRIGWVEAGAHRLGDAPVRNAARAALITAGAEVVDITLDLPDVDFGPIFDYGMTHGVTQYLVATNAPVGTLAEVIAFNQRDLRRYAPRGQALLERAVRSTLTRAEYEELVRSNRERALAAVRGTLATHQLDLLLTFRPYAAFNMAGVPLLSLPIGYLTNGDPIPALLVADLGADAELLAAGRALELALQSSTGFAQTAR
jgi:amidase